MADISKIDVLKYLEPNGEPELVENLHRITEQFYGSKNGELINALDEELTDSIVTVLQTYGILPVMVSLLANGGSSGGGVSYDIKFMANAAEPITGSTSSKVTVTNAALEALQDMQTLLNNFDANATINVTGGFKYTDSTYGDMYYPATLEYADKIDNTTAKALLSQLGISDVGDKDVLLIQIDGAYNPTAYSNPFVIYEAADGTVKTVSIA